MCRVVYVTATEFIGRLIGYCGASSADLSVRMGHEREYLSNCVRDGVDPKVRTAIDLASLLGFRLVVVPFSKGPAVVLRSERPLEGFRVTGDEGDEGAVIDVLAAAAGRPQSELSVTLGYSKTYLQRVVSRGRSPRLSVIADMAWCAGYRLMCVEPTGRIAFEVLSCLDVEVED